jgi:branched-chain amino acid transport system permease protein
MTQLTAQAVNALMLGSTYAVVALGIVLIFAVLDVMSLAQGQILVAAGYVGFVTVLTATGSLALAVLVTVVAGFLLGVVVERLAVRPAASGGHMATLVTTLGAGMVIINALILIKGPYQRGVNTGGMVHSLFFISHVPINWAEVSTLIILLIGFVVVHWVTQRTSAGRVVRAAAENPRVAGVFGVNIGRVRMLTFAAGSALAGLGGVMLILQYGSVSPDFGVTYTLMGLTAVLLGGANGVVGAAVASFLLAGIQVAAITYIGAGYGDVMTFGSLFLILLVRPQGLFTRLERQGG